MNRIFGMIALIMVNGPQINAQQMADTYYDPAEMARARNVLKHHHGGQRTAMFMADRSEYQTGDGEPGYVWDAQGWYGNDLNKFWLKTEGEIVFAGGEVEEAELQGLYSRAVSAFWDVQGGIRYDVTPNPSRTYAVLGLQGLAPYWFEIDAASFISNKGDVSLRLEIEYEIRLQQRLILQPRVEVDLSFSDDEATRTGSGISGIEAGLRLRYEITGEFAPYLGINWSRAFGETADIIRKQDSENENLSFIAGVRFWY